MRTQLEMFVYLSQCMYSYLACVFNNIKNSDKYLYMHMPSNQAGQSEYRRAVSKNTANKCNTRTNKHILSQITYIEETW